MNQNPVVEHISWSTKGMTREMLNRLKRLAASRGWTLTKAHRVALMMGLTALEAAEKEK